VVAAHRTRTWLSGAALLALVAAAVVLFLPVTIAPSAGSGVTACGTVVSRGPVYPSTLGRGTAPVTFLTSAQYQRIQDCDAGRHRDAIISGVLAAAALGLGALARVS
jgi:hypothetical protein